MPQGHTPDLAAVELWLSTACITSRQHWDMLVFLYRHPTSLVSAEHIALLLGYATGDVVATLEHLASLGFVERSRVSQGVRLYQFTAPTDTPPGDACHQLMRVADSRTVRLSLARRWQHHDSSPRASTRSATLSSLKGDQAWQKAS